MNRDARNIRDIREIESITFGVYSPEEIESMSVCKIDNPKKSGLGTVYDPRMGTTDSTQACETCKQNAIDCHGHFGHIELNEPVVHPLFYKRVTAFLNCFCMKCYRLLLTKDQIYLAGLNRYKGETRFNQILEKLKKVDICCQPTGEVDEDGEPVLCRKDKPKIKFSIGDSSYSMVYEDGKKSKTSIIITTEEIKKIFDNVSPEDVELMGFDPSLTHPRNFIITVLPVCPPIDRPYVKADGKTCDDDLTITYCLHPDTPVLLWSGNTKLAKDIEPEDILIDSAGNPTEVDAICFGKDQMYKICQGNGDDYIVNSQHRLSLKFSGHKSVFWSKTKNAWQMLWLDRNTMKRRITSVYTTPSVSKEEALFKLEQIRDTISDDSFVDISVQDYIQLNQSTKKMLCGYKVSGINWSKKEVMLDPYILGMWLGDGNARGDGFASNDTELIMEWIHWACKNDAEIVHNGPCAFNVRGKNTGRRPAVGTIESNSLECKGCIKKLCELCKSDAELMEENREPLIKKLPYRPVRKRDNPLKRYLRHYNLIENKHIPLDYLINDKETRLQLFAGLLDTDGSRSTSSESFKFSQVVPEHQSIIDGVEFLARSLGLSCSRSSSWRETLTGEQRQHIILIISGDNMLDVPLRLGRKKCDRINRKNALTTGITVESVGMGEYCGFQVKGDDKHFLLSDFTVTHNCEIIKANNNLADEECDDEDGEKRRGRKKKEQTEQDRVKARASLRFRISTMMNNSGGKSKHSTNGKHCRSLAARRWLVLSRGRHT